jgi:outer membrane protein assembly factor BamB
MPGTPKVFISHTHADNERCAPLLAMLDAWGILYWFDVEQLHAGQELNQRLQEALAESAIFIRVCTPEAQQSFWMSLELSAYRGLAQGGGRKLLFLILDREYVLEPLQKGDVVIDTTTQQKNAWIAHLRSELGIKAASRQLSRRAVIGLGALATLSLASAGTGAVVYASRSLNQTPRLPRPRSYLPTPTPVEGAERVKWSFTYEDQETAGITAFGANLYVSTGDGLYALAGKDGSQLWFAPNNAQGGDGGAPQIVGNDLYTMDALGNLVASRRSDGSRHWRTFLNYSFSNTTLAATSSGIYVWFNGYLYAVRPDDGALLWKVPLGPTSSIYSAGCAASANLVYLNAPDGYLYAVSAASGSVQWKQPVQSTAIPTVADGVLYVGSQNNNLYALDAQSGGLLWSSNLQAPAGGQVTLAGRMALVGTDNGLVAVDLDTHAVRWAGTSATGAFGSSVSCRPAVGGEVVYVTTGDGYLVAFRLSDGTRLWRFAGGGQDLSSSPALVNGLVYFSAGSDQHTIYALDASAS